MTDVDAKHDMRETARKEGDTETDAISPSTIRWLLHRKVLAAQRHRAAVARRVGISESEVTALAYLAQGALTPGQLGDRLQLTSGGVTALLHRLEKGGHIKRHAHPRDKRSVVLTVSRQILDDVGDCYAPLAAGQDELTAQLSARDREVVATYLERIALVSERHVDEMIARIDKEVTELVDDDAWQLWA